MELNWALSTFWPFKSEQMQFKFRKRMSARELECANNPCKWFFTWLPLAYMHIAWNKLCFVVTKFRRRNIQINENTKVYQILWSLEFLLLVGITIAMCIHPKANSNKIYLYIRMYEAMSSCKSVSLFRYEINE